MPPYWETLPLFINTFIKSLAISIPLFTDSFHIENRGIESNMQWGKGEQLRRSQQAEFELGSIASKV